MLVPSRSVRAPLGVMLSLWAAGCAQLDESPAADGNLPADSGVYVYADSGVTGGYDGGAYAPASPSTPSTPSFPAGADATVFNIDLGSLFGGADGGAVAPSGDGGSATSGDPACKDQICVDVFDCFLFHPDKGSCGFTACEAFVCK